MSKNRTSAAGRLYYTFGTVFLMAVITVCTMNFSKDSRIMNRPAAAVSTESTSSKPEKPADNGQTETKRTETGKSKTAQTKSEKAKTGQGGTLNGSGTNKKTQVNPGEEP